AGELIEVVHRLRAKDRLPGRDRVERDRAAAVIALDVQARKILGVPAEFILDFQYDLVLILRAFDQVDVVLAISVTNQGLDSGRGDAVHRRLVAQDVNTQVWGAEI